MFSIFFETNRVESLTSEDSLEPISFKSDFFSWLTTEIPVITYIDFISTHLEVTVPNVMTSEFEERVAIINVVFLIDRSGLETERSISIGFSQNLSLLFHPVISGRLSTVCEGRSVAT